MKQLADVVSVNNLTQISFENMMKGLSPFVLEPLPEGGAGDPVVLAKIDRQLGRLANLYAYLVYLWAHASSETNKYKLRGADAEYHVMMRKKEALYELSRAVKLKWEAASRMITVQQEQDEEETFERANYPARSARAIQRKERKDAQKPGGGWSHV